jgi:hypothetical protein
MGNPLKPAWENNDPGKDIRVGTEIPEMPTETCQMECVRRRSVRAEREGEGSDYILQERDWRG